MAHSTYQEIRTALKHGCPFVGNSAQARRNDHGRYNVYSYGTRILSIDGDTVTYFNNVRYSHTTSRLQNIIRDEVPQVKDCTARVIYKRDALTGHLVPRQ